MSRWLTIIGIGEDGIEALPRALQSLIERAELIVGGERHLAMVPHGTRREEELGLAVVADRRRDLVAARPPVVVLATGDPMCFGIGVTLAKRVPAEEMAVHPQHLRLHAGRRAHAAGRWPMSSA